MLRRLLVMLAVPAALAGALPAVAATPDLHRIVLSPAQVGPGYRVEVVGHGTEVQGQVTLDLCGFRFPSEALRVARLQVKYLHSGSAPELSNEVVRYRAGGAQQGLHEIANAAGHCPRGPVGSTVRGVPRLTYRVRPITGLGLLSGYVAFRLSVSGKVKGKQFELTLFAIYQAKANVLSAVYTSGKGSIAAQQQIGLHAAEESAKNLKRFA